jgi:hypothetical protein
MSLSVELIRPDDFLSLTVGAFNLRLDASHPGGPALVRQDQRVPAFLVVTFPPQSVGEEAFFEGLTETDSDARKAPGDVQSRLSGPSRLAFRVPESVASIPYTLEGLLDWTALVPSLAPLRALVGQPFFPPDTQPPPVAAPSDTETSIELPWRLILSPGPDARWRHAMQPRTHRGRTELWHTRLVPPGGPRAELSDEVKADIRAIFSPDYNADNPPKMADTGPFRSSLQPLDRHQLVQLTSTFGIQRPGFHSDLGKPAHASRLALSALGGSLHADGDWPDEPSHISLVSWRHTASFARDDYVTVVRRGRFFPFMHRASWIKITDRRFESFPSSTPSGQPVSYLRQFQLLDGIQLDVRYTGEAFDSAGREMPLAELIRINTRTTPRISEPVFIKGPPLAGGPDVQTASFEVRVGGALFPFSLTGIDPAGNAADFTSPLIFIPDDDIPDNVDVVARHWREQMTKADRSARVANKQVAIAPPEPGSATTTFTTTAFNFDAQLGAGPGGFLPVMSSVEVRVPSIEAVTSKETPTEVAFFGKYLAGGFGAAGGVFAQVVGNLNVGFSADQAGGIAKPDMSVGGFARSVGPVAGDVAKASLGTFDPAAAFNGIDAKLFGVLPLKDILNEGDFASSAPAITTRLDPTPAAPTATVTRLAWSAVPKPKDIPPLVFAPQAATRLAIDVTITQPLTSAGGAPGAPSIRVEGRLNDFTVTLKEVLAISFREFRFLSVSGGKPSVNVDLAPGLPLEFQGALAFVHKLTDLIPPGLFGDSGPTLKLTADAVEVGFALGLPPASLGVFTIRNIGISTSLRLPFLLGQPSFAFGFAARQKPFQLAVLILGGGGFFRIELDTEKVRLVEGMLEFGGVLALDIGVASGSISIMAGIYFALRSDAAELTGFVDVSGELTILGLVSVSVEFNLSLTYYLRDNVVKGVATVSVSVRIAFVSKSVSFSVERSFSAGSDHISIAEAMTPGDWQAYAGAFG